VTLYVAATDSIFGCNRYKGMEGGFRACSDGEACLMQVFKTLGFAIHPSAFCCLSCHTLDTVSSDTLHTMSSHTLHTVSCDTLDTVSSDTLDTVSSGTLHTMSCDTQHAVSCNIWHPIYHVYTLHTVSSGTLHTMSTLCILCLVTP